MQLKQVIGLAAIIAVVAIGLATRPQPASGYSDPILQEMHFSGNDFAVGQMAGAVSSDAGLRLAAAANSTVYTSPELTAVIPFNAVVPQWRADLPTGTSLSVRLRSKTAVSDWTAWQTISGDNDAMLPGDAQTVGQLITVPAADQRHTHIQYQIGLSRYDGQASPVLHDLTLTLIDATAGPTVDQMLAQQQALDAASGIQPTAVNGRPSVISRAVWCQSADCTYSDDLVYSPATHLVVHHTVSSNSSPDWAATVRAIWSFHTYTKGWGDIGYNYLVDRNGIIYEGHYSEDYLNLDVAGTHASGANVGSMGVALLGTFTEANDPLPGIVPPDPMLDSLVALLSWKAEQRHIDVYDASDTLPNVPWGLPHLMGHRDAYGTTECPGDQAHRLLPAIRDRVAANIGLTWDYIVVDELSADFTHSSAPFAVGDNGCGNNGHAFYTWSTTNPALSKNWGEWRPTLPTADFYEIEARVPYCYTGRGETDGATYDVQYKQGETAVPISQEAQLGNWISLGTFDLAAGQSLIRLTDLTQTDSGLGVWFDDIRLRPKAPAATAVSPSGWISETAVLFDWQLPYTDIQTTTLKVSASPTLANPIIDASWGGRVTSYAHDFAGQQLGLYWQATAVLADTGRQIKTPIVPFGMDTAVPSSSASLYHHHGNDYVVAWQGQDNLSGIGGYDVAWRKATTADWTPWFTNTLQTSAIFTPPVVGYVYQFRVEATDAAGNAEPRKTAPDVTTQQAIWLLHDIMLPIVRR